MLNSIRRRQYSHTLPAKIALSLLACAMQSAFALEEAVEIPSVIVSGTSTMPAAAKIAPSQSSLDARSAQSLISDEFIRNFTSPVSDYSQILQMAPGMFSYSPNGVGLGDTKTTMRGYSDSNAVIMFDGIPFNDTNGVSHHSWVFFPSQFIGGTVIDRSPGSASSIGQANFVGSINLLSRVMKKEQETSITGSSGTWNTTMLGAETSTGKFGPNGSANLLFNVNEMKSDGYQNLNKQKRDATSLKYQNELSSDTVMTAFTSFLNLKTNTPNIKGVSRANVQAQNYTVLLSPNATDANYVGFNRYNIYTNFNYLGLESNLGNGWKLDEKVYTYRYWNKQNYNSATAITTTSAVDKLNSYVTKGNVLRLSQESEMGTLRAGLWIDYADSYRYQYPSDPRTGIDAATPNFSETYQTTTVQPYIEYEFKITKDLKITPGVKYASYKQSFNHLQDNGGAVGTLGGVYNKTTFVTTGGAPFVANDVRYTDVMPSFDVHYVMRPNWSVYGQYSVGDQIPSTNVFDVPNAKVTTTPLPTKAKTVQFGSVFKSEGFTLDADIYRTTLDNPYSSSIDIVTGNPVFTLNGTAITQGVEIESNIILGSGLSVYLNQTYGSAKYNTGMWVAGAPADTRSLGLNYQQGSLDAGVFFKRVGTVYADNGSTHQAFTIAPVTLANLFVNYTLAQAMPFMKSAKLQLAVNNLFNRHDIVDVAAAGTKTSSSLVPSAADLLNVLPARSVSLTFTAAF